MLISTAVVRHIVCLLWSRTVWFYLHIRVRYLWQYEKQNRQWTSHIWTQPARQSNASNQTDNHSQRHIQKGFSHYAIALCSSKICFIRNKKLASFKLPYWNSACVAEICIVMLLPLYCYCYGITFVLLLCISQ